VRGGSGEGGGESETPSHCLTNEHTAGWNCTSAAVGGSRSFHLALARVRVRKCTPI
jgi:hypothetical protein